MAKARSKVAGACAATRLARVRARDAGENDHTHTVRMPTHTQSGCPRTHGQDAHALTVRMPTHSHGTHGQQAQKASARSGN